MTRQRQSLRALLIASLKPLPTEPGMYFWDHWGCVVEVYKKRGGRCLYTKPPGGIEVKISPRIAGRFIAQDAKKVSPITQRKRAAATGELFAPAKEASCA